MAEEEKVEAKLLGLNKVISTEYKIITRLLLLFSCWGILCGLVLGLVGREVNRPLNYEKVGAGKIDYPKSLLKFEGTNIEARLDMSILHGHVLLMCGFIPMMMAVMLLIGKIIGGGEIKYGSLKISVGMYAVGSICSVILLFYKVPKFSQTLLIVKIGRSYRCYHFE